MNEQYNYPLCFTKYKDNGEYFKKKLVLYYKNFMNNSFNYEDIKAFLITLDFSGYNIRSIEINEEYFNNTSGIWDCSCIRNEYKDIEHTFCMVCALNSHSINEYKLYEEQVVSYLIKHPFAHKTLADMGFVSDCLKSAIFYFKDNDLVLVYALKELYDISFQCCDKKAEMNRDYAYLVLEYKGTYNEYDIKITMDYFDYLNQLEISRDIFISSISEIKNSVLNKRNNNDVNIPNANKTIDIGVMKRLDNNQQTPTVNNIMDMITGPIEASTKINTTLTNVYKGDLTKDKQEEDILGCEQTTIFNDLDYKIDMPVVERVIIDNNEAFNINKTYLLSCDVLYLAFVEDGTLLLNAKCNKKFTYYKIVDPYQLTDGLLEILTSSTIVKIINTLKPFRKLLETRVVDIKNIFSLPLADTVLKDSFNINELIHSYKNETIDRYVEIPFNKINNTYEKYLRMLTKNRCINYYNEVIEAYKYISYSDDNHEPDYYIQVILLNDIKDIIYKKENEHKSSWEYIIQKCVLAFFNSDSYKLEKLCISNANNNSITAGCDVEYIPLLADMMNLTLIKIFKAYIDNAIKPHIRIKKL